MTILIKKGIDLPIKGKVEDSSIKDFGLTGSVAVIGDDYLGVKPTMLVAEGDLVKEGQALLEDKKNPGVYICAPAAGKVVAINRGEKRKLLSVVIETVSDGESVSFPAMDFQAIASLSDKDIRSRLQETGYWAMFRQRPYSKIPKIDGQPHSIFVNVMDSNPLSLDPSITLKNRQDDFKMGLSVISQLTQGKIHLCHGDQQEIPEFSSEKVEKHTFKGIHPVGNVGTHIHYIDSASMDKPVWYLNIQDLLAIGHLFHAGKIDNQRVIAVSGPGVTKPQYVKLNRGSDLQAVLQGNLAEGEQRIISGSVFSGRKIDDKTHYLSAYDQQVIVLPEGRDSKLLEYLRPGFKAYSKTSAYVGKYFHKYLPFTTSVQGSPRPILPFSIYESVMPLDILPVLLIKALVIKDTDTAVQLGALELDEEDLALLTYVDPAKHDFGAILRENLEQIEKDG